MSKKKNFLKIVILGDSGVGKTTLLQQYVSGKSNPHSKPTIGADFSKKELMIDNTVVTLQIWDTAGQEKFQSLGYAFCYITLSADCCALVYDITNQKSFDDLNKWRDGFIEHAAPPDPNTFPFVVIGNKLDRESERRVKTSDAQAWSKENGDIKISNQQSHIQISEILIKYVDITYYETSAKENISVDDAFIEMAKMAIKRDQTSGQLFGLPETIGGAGGALKLNAKDDQRRIIY